MQAACELGDRRACDAAEFEGRPPAGGGGGSSPWPLGRADHAFAWALLPLLLLSLLARLWRRPSGARPAGTGLDIPGLRSRCVWCVHPTAATAAATAS
jgi:hypothetical protein